MFSLGPFKNAYIDWLPRRRDFCCVFPRVPLSSSVSFFLCAPISLSLYTHSHMCVCVLIVVKVALFSLCFLLILFASSSIKLLHMFFVFWRLVLVFSLLLLFLTSQFLYPLLIELEGILLVMKSITVFWIYDMYLTLVGQKIIIITYCVVYSLVYFWYILYLVPFGGIFFFF